MTREMQLILHAAEQGHSWLYAAGMLLADIYPDGTAEDKIWVALNFSARGLDTAEALEGYESALNIRRANALLG